MFSRPFQSVNSRLLVRIVSCDQVLVDRIATVLETTNRYVIERPGAGARLNMPVPEDAVALLIADIADAQEADGLSATLAASPRQVPTIALASNISQKLARDLIRMQVTELLDRSFRDDELIAACDQAVRPSRSEGGQTHATCIAFVPAIGGAGATTLAVAAASLLCRPSKKREAPRCCLVDLDFQRGAVADHLNIQPNLQLDELRDRPERLDDQLLEIMLSRHATGLAALAAPVSLANRGANGDLLGRLLDLTASAFDRVIIDLPSHWPDWGQSIALGLDHLFIVTELTVPGLRHAHRMSNDLETLGLGDRLSIIANKAPWMGGGVTQGQARELLGPRLAGAVGDASSLCREAQNRGVTLDAVKKSNPIFRGLEGILKASPCGAKLFKVQ